MKLIIDHVKKSYGDKEVLRDISFSFESGKIYGLLGRNGAGKTTLFSGHQPGRAGKHRRASTVSHTPGSRL